MEKEFIPYEQALQLKELGFDEPCFGYYIETGEWIPASYSREGTVYPSNSDLLPEWISAPLYQQAFRWFRENHKLNFECKTPDGKAGKWFPGIHKVYGFGNMFDNDGFATHEEAELACLNKLIELIKTK